MVALKGEFHVSAHGQTVTSAQLFPLLLKQSKALMQEKETIPYKCNYWGQLFSYFYSVMS